MSHIDLSVGHGRQSSGRYDPGAVAGDGTQEHMLAHKVVDVATAVLRNRGFQVRKEADAGNSHDPNFSGSRARVESTNPRIAVEVHFDWSGAPRGGFGLYYYAEGGKVSAAIRQAWKAAGLPVRPNAQRTDLSFIRANPPRSAVIWECDRVHSYTDTMLREMGEALADGITAYLGGAAETDELYRVKRSWWRRTRKLPLEKALQRFEGSAKSIYGPFFIIKPNGEKQYKAKRAGAIAAVEWHAPRLEQWERVTLRGGGSRRLTLVRVR